MQTRVAYKPAITVGGDRTGRRNRSTHPDEPIESKSLSTDEAGLDRGAIEEGGRLRH
ncbi:MAG: hypothetical protein O7C01_00210 [Actinobacteria bacterium]|nr:hypothetical protein [Actinomycetota bacterium]